jgi:hypothetical protein
MEKTIRSGRAAWFSGAGHAASRNPVDLTVLLLVVSRPGQPDRFEVYTHYPQRADLNTRERFSSVNDANAHFESLTG